MTNNAPRFDTVAGNTQVRRALEIALVGGHPITFVGKREAHAFYDALRQYGFSGYRFCDCCPDPFAGVYVNVLGRTADDAESRAWLRRCLEDVSITIGTRDDETEYPTETDEQFLERVVSLQSRTTSQIDLNGDCRERLAWICRQHALDAAALSRVIAVARTIAQVGGAQSIGFAHFFEALHYWDQTRSVVRQLEYEGI